MAALEISFIWIAYAIVIAILVFVAAVFVTLYQSHRERSVLVTVVSIFTLTALLATVLLLPVDIALVSSTTSNKTGLKKDWATPERVHKIVLSLKIVYYTLYSLDALLCLLVIPFTYFFYEEYEENEEVADQSIGKRFWGAMKYSIVFLLLVVIIFIVGFFVPIAGNRKDIDLDLDYLKKLLTENHGERALTFALGLLLCFGSLLYLLYTAAGLALLPVSMIKSAPLISSPSNVANTQSALTLNRERQRIIEARNSGRENGLPAKDRRELEQLQREERTLVRRERLAAESSSEGKGWVTKAWRKMQAIFRPVKLIGGVLILILALVIFGSMIKTGVDKIIHSPCGKHCGYILDVNYGANPVDALLTVSSRVFPVDYVLVIILVLIFFASTIVGMTFIGIRFLWVTIFKFRKAQTPPQALLIATVMLTLMTLAINYAIVEFIAPRYSVYGAQAYCSHSSKSCQDHSGFITPCVLSAFYSLTPEIRDLANEVCTPTIASTFLNRISLNYPFFGGLAFWTQFVFLGVFLITVITALIRTPTTGDVDDDTEEAEEEEGLLAGTRRRFGATWEDITGRARGRGADAQNGRSGRPSGLEEGQEHEED